MNQKIKRFFASALIACLLGTATLPAAAASAVHLLVAAFVKLTKAYKIIEN